ncbi:MAG TPA: hypothetical protein VF212_05190 [Longimicrobiales bacterium]
MPAASTAVAHRAHAPSTTVVLAGTLAGTLDGLFALSLQFAYTGAIAPVRLFQGIAYGALGDEAFAGGAATALLGLALHFGFAYAWAGVYFAAHRWLPPMRSITRTRAGAAAAGAGFGTLVWLVMNAVVKPIGGIPPTPVASGMFAIMLAGHIAVVGWPIAAVVRATARRLGAASGDAGPGGAPE